METKKNKVVLTEKQNFKIKNIVAKAKRKKRIKLHTDAFLKYPVEFEFHKGKVSFFI